MAKKETTEQKPTTLVDTPGPGYVPLTDTPTSPRPPKGPPPEPPPPEKFKKGA